LSSALEIPYTSFGRAIRFLRDNANLSQEQVAERSGIHPTQISLLETGKSNPTHKTLHRLADGLDVPCSWILTLEEIYARRLDG
jgi:transcriptional regulator with XRE-family HTH domain